MNGAGDATLRWASRARVDLLVGSAIAIAVTVQIINVNTAYPTLPAGRVAAVLACQLGVGLAALVHCLRWARPLRDAVWPFTLTVQGVLTLVPVAGFGLFWGGAPAFFLGSCLLLLPTAVAWSALAVTETATLIWAPSPVFYYPLYLVVANVTVAFMVWGLTRVVDTFVAVRASRDEAARLAVALEQQRFTRDLHDLLGYSLSAMTLKAELAARFAETAPQRARQELIEVGDLALEARADVRAVAHGDRSLSLASQLDSARTVAGFAGVEIVVLDDDIVLPPVVDTVLATVVREGITNVMRHSRARRCTIVVARAGLDPSDVLVRIENDGAEPDVGTAPGRGLGNLRARLDSVGGRLHAERPRDHCFVLTATVPVPE